MMFSHPVLPPLHADWQSAHDIAASNVELFVCCFVAFALAGGLLAVGLWLEVRREHLRSIRIEAPAEDDQDVRGPYLGLVR